MDPTTEERRSGIARLVSLFSNTQLGDEPNQWISLARSLAVQLRSPSVDWRDLARALEQVRSNAPSSSALAMFDRAALFAMRLAEFDTTPKASAEMLDACAPGVSPEDMLRSVVAILERQIPFDLVSYAEYYHSAEAAEGTTLVRGRFAMDGGTEFRWPARWVEIPGDIARWAEGDVRWVADSEEFYKEYPQAEDLRDNIVTREYERRGAASYLVAPLLDGGRVKAVLTLARRRNSPPGPFGRADQQKLEALLMERIVRRINEAFDMRAQVVAKDIIALFTPQAEPPVLAQKLVEKLCRGFEWEYIGLFRVNRAHEMFEVAAEHDANGKLKLPPTYEQPLSEGMLGKTLKAGHALYVPDVNRKSGTHNYIRVSPSHASALTFPIRIGPDPDAEIEWILDLESSQLNAFPFPEQELLRRTVVEVERAVALWFEARLATTLLNIVEQGVVVLGGRTRIERANAAALRMLGLPKDFDFSRNAALPVKASKKNRARLRDFATYAADKTTREFVAGDQESGAGIHLRLRGADQVMRTALAVASYRDQAFHRRILLLADVEQAQWVGALKYMEAAVRAVAAQAHGRLALAGALLRSARGTLSPNTKAFELLERAEGNLACADLPYERIASVFDVMLAPKLRHGFLDLAGELRRFRGALPPDEADSVQLDYEDDRTVIVVGDPERLAFVFRSLVGHLLAVRASDSPLKVSISVSQGRAFVNLAVSARDSASVAAGLTDVTPDEQNRPQDQIAHVESLAFAVATHAVDAIRKVIRAHRGKLTVERQNDEVIVCVGGLPVLPEGASTKVTGSAAPATKETPQ